MLNCHKISRFLLTIVLALLYTAGSLFAQQLIKGVVKDDKKVLLPGVSVVIVGTTNGSTTDAAGVYTLRTTAGSYKVSYSFIGFGTITRDVTVASSDVSIDVELEPSTANPRSTARYSIGCRRSTP